MRRLIALLGSGIVVGLALIANPFISSVSAQECASPVTEGDQAEVTAQDGITVYSTTGQTARKIGTLEAGEVFHVAGDAVCFGRNAWVPILFNNKVRWTMVDRNGTDLVLKVTSSGSGIPVDTNCSMTTDLTTGVWAMVTPGTPNRLRAQPNTESDILLLVPGGASFTVTGLPECHDTIVWVPLTYNGQAGWTMLGQRGEHWVVASSAPSTDCDMTSPFTMGEFGRVTPGDPNGHREGPGRNYQSVGLIPGSASFEVIGVAECRGGTNWLPVEYDRQQGWTAIGKDGVYWVEEPN